MKVSEAEKEFHEKFYCSRFDPICSDGLRRQGKKRCFYDQRVSRLTEQVQMLQQTIDILAKETKNLQGELTALKTQSSQGHADSALLKELEVRVSDLEGSGYLK